MSNKVVHIGGGLGNQMASYITLFLAREMNVNDDFFIETLVYDVKDANKVCNQWNGYELKRIFGIEENNIIDILSQAKKESLIQDLIKTKFWKHGNEDICIYNTLVKYNLLDLPYIDVEDKDKRKTITTMIKNYVGKNSKFYFNYLLKNTIKYIYSKRKYNDYIGYKEIKGDYYYPGCSFEFMKSQYLQEKLGNKVKEVFKFPEIKDEKNKKILSIIKNSESVSIHARRSDFLKYNGDCYKYGYFKKCVRYIKNKVKNPIFIIFSEDSDWCKNNLEIFGLNNLKDNIYFVDFNNDNNSYIDMQLMSLCKHNIITKSSFGWWASFLNLNPNKITCCQISDYITTNQF